MGVAAYFVSSSWLTLQLGGGTQGLAILAAGLAVPALVLGLSSGLLIDRRERRRLAQYAELLRVAAAGTVALSGMAGELRVWQLHLSGLVIGVGTAVTLPCYAAILPRVAVGDRLVRTNAHWQIVTQIGTIAGSMLGGELVSAWGSYALWLPVAGYAGAALLLQTVPPDAVRSTGRPRRRNA